MSEKKKEIVEAQLNVYRDNFIKHGDTPMGTRQNDRKTQFLRFEKLIKNIDFPPGDKVTIHDIGSGLCDLYEYLKIQNKEVSYSGTEIVQEMIDMSLKKYPEINLTNRDILNEVITDKYDFVVLSGMFNMPGNVEEKNWQDFIFSIINKMFSMATKGIAFNFLTTYKTLTDPTLFYAAPESIFRYCTNNLSRFTILDHSYALYEYTITVYKKEYIKEKYEQETFAKYFK